MSRKTKKLWKLTALLAVNLALLVLISSVCARAERLGTSGERVAQIQHELQKRQLYGEKTNGIFDFKMKNAVAEFQRMSGLEISGEATHETLCLLGLDSQHSECFSARVEVIARCIGMSGCRTYPEMFFKADEILAKTDGAMTLGQYIGENYPDFWTDAEVPSDEEYSAAITAIRKSAQK